MFDTCKQFLQPEIGTLVLKSSLTINKEKALKVMFPLSFVEPCQTQSNMAYMSAWYIAIPGQMLADYSQNINLVAAAPSRGSAGYWKHRGGTGDTVETCPDTITISNNTILHRGKCCNEW